MPIRELPAHPNLEHLKNQARTLLREPLASEHPRRALLTATSPRRPSSPTPSTSLPVSTASTPGLRSNSISRWPPPTPSKPLLQPSKPTTLHSFEMFWPSSLSQILHR